MKTCFSCGKLAVDPEDVPRYDVLNPDRDPNLPLSTVGPYCPTCWKDTVTGKVTEVSHDEE